MPVSENTIKALTSPETRAKSLATRRRNKEAKEALKNKIMLDKFEEQSGDLLSKVKTELINETSNTFKISNLEYKVKTLESQQESIKEQVSLISNTRNPPTTPINYTTTQDNPEIKQDLKQVKKNIKKISESLNELTEGSEQNDTEIAQLFTLSRQHDQKFKSLEDRLERKIDHLFQIIYNSTPNRAHLNQYCNFYNTEQQPTQSPRSHR